MSNAPFLPKPIRYTYIFHMLKHIPSIKEQEKQRYSEPEHVFKHYLTFKRGVSNWLNRRLKPYYRKTLQIWQFFWLPILDDRTVRTRRCCLRSTDTSNENRYWQVFALPDDCVLRTQYGNYSFTCQAANQCVYKASPSPL
jgi:hypothetical protein